MCVGQEHSDWERAFRSRFEFTPTVERIELLGDLLEAATKALESYEKRRWIPWAWVETWRKAKDAFDGS